MSFAIALRFALLSLAVLVLPWETVNAAEIPKELQAPAPLKHQCPNPPRTKAEVNAVLAKGKLPKAVDLKPINIVLAAGKKDHGPESHDYPFWQQRWAKLMPLAPKVELSTAYPWPSKEQFAKADVIVFYQSMLTMTEEQTAQLNKYLNEGGGAAFIHWGVNGAKFPEQQSRNVGLVWSRGSKYRHGPVDLKFVDQEHPIARGFEKVHFHDEAYWNLTGDKKRIQILAGSVEDKEPRPLVWVRQHGKGRVFVNILGHFTWTFDDPMFRIITCRGIAWAAGSDVDRFHSIVNIGARVK